MNEKNNNKNQKMNLPSIDNNRKNNKLKINNTNKNKANDSSNLASSQKNSIKEKSSTEKTFSNQKDSKANLIIPKYDNNLLKQKSNMINKSGINEIIDKINKQKINSKDINKSMNFIENNSKKI